MADDERAAKAARAKALLKKRQQQKKNDTIASSSGTHSPGASISRTSTPAPLTQGSVSISRTLTSPPPNIDVASGFAATLPQSEHERVDSLSPHRENAHAHAQEEDYVRTLQDQRQTIALLVSEKATLVEALERLEGVDSKLRISQVDLKNKLQEVGRLQVELSRVEKERNTSSHESRELEARNSALTSKLREQERELHTTRGEIDNLRAQMKESDRQIRDLNEQIQNDDRVDILEAKIRNTQDRAEEVNFQLSKLKQAYDKLKAEHDELQNECQNKSLAEQQIKSQIASLEDSLRSSEDKLNTLVSERDTLTGANASAVAELQTSQATIAELNNKLSQATVDLAAAAKQLENLQIELRQALRRAEDAEISQRDLQEEGTGLMRSLDEMRPKIVELTGAKLELMEKLDQLTATLSQRDSMISELEAQLESANASINEYRQEHERLERQQEKEKSNAEAGHAELQRAYNELQAQFDDTLSATREVEADRGKQRQATARLQEELNHLRSIEQANQEEIDLLRSQMDEREQAGDDDRRLLEELQQEIEALRLGVTAKEEEISRLRQIGPSGSSSLPSSHSLDDEVKGVITQQLELELSNAKSTIRGLESTLYDAEAKYLSLQKHVAAVENELSQLRTAATTHRPSRGGSVTARYSDDLRRTSFASQRTNNLSRLTPTALIDKGLPPETRHRRHISLAMLQARMYSEAEAASAQATTSKMSKGNSAGHSHSNVGSVDSSVLSLRWPQFLDESHVFWCATCKGDLIVL